MTIRRKTAKKKAPKRRNPEKIVFLVYKDESGKFNFPIEAYSSNGLAGRRCDELNSEYGKEIFHSYAVPLDLFI